MFWRQSYKNMILYLCQLLCYAKWNVNLKLRLPIAKWSQYGIKRRKLQSELRKLSVRWHLTYPKNVKFLNDVKKYINCYINISISTEISIHESIRKRWYYWSAKYQIPRKMSVLDVHTGELIHQQEDTSQHDQENINDMLRDR